MENRDNVGGCHLNIHGCSKGSSLKMDTFDWLCDIPEANGQTDLVEVTFKNTRKGYYRNTNELRLEKGDLVAVEASPGHDIGTVSLTGPLVLLQMKKNKIDPTKSEIKRIYRKAKQVDIEKYEEVKALEVETMIRSRQIAESLHLDMKIGDVEYQGDGNKAIFYYIADNRVDFRQLIKLLAEAFKVRIEMKQIGARQEAGRIGGIGPCGRPLCCSQWMSNFVSVSTNAARYQDISPNPQKLAGQCAKLKCCMNFEVDTYMEAHKELPPKDVPLETIDGTYYLFKMDILSRRLQYSTAPNMAANIVAISAARAREVIEMNKQGIKPASLKDDGTPKKVEKTVDYENVVGQDSLTRFDKKKKKKNRDNRQRDRRNGGEESVTAQAGQQGAQQNSNQQQGGQQQERRDRNDRRDRRDGGQNRGDRRDRNDRRDRRDRRDGGQQNENNKPAEGEQK